MRPLAARALCLALLALAPAACTRRPAPTEPSATALTAPSASAPSAPSASAKPERPSIGQAEMLPDGTLVLDLTARSGGAIGHARVTYAPTDPKYAKTLEHLGGMKPGEKKLVPPWPDDIDDAAVEATVKAWASEKKGWKPERVRVEADGTYENGDVSASVTYAGDDPQKRVVVHLRLDPKGKSVLHELAPP